MALFGAFGNVHYLACGGPALASAYRCAICNNCV